MVHDEVLPLRPDLVVYYEGGNQFRLQSRCAEGKMPKGTPQRPPAGDEPRPVAAASARAIRRCATRIQAALALRRSRQDDGKEWPKPDYKVVWPPGLDEQDPDLAYPDLPINLNIIEATSTASAATSPASAASLR